MGTPMIETRYYSGMLYALADKHRGDRRAELLDAAERLDALTVTVRGMMIERDSYRDVIEAALAWWESIGPVEYRLDDHICHPMVNCSGEPERALARAVVALLDYRRQAKDGRLE